MQTVTPELVSAVAGIVLSLGMSYIPRLKDWYDQLTPTPKRLLMLFLLALATLLILIYRCRTDAACFGVEWEAYLTAFIAALIANQAAHSITPLPARRSAVRAEAASRDLLDALQH